MARNMWVQEQELGEVLDRRELEAFLKTSVRAGRREAPETAAAEGRRHRTPSGRRAEAAELLHFLFPKECSCG